MYGRSATHAELKAETKMVPNIMETKPNKNANNMKVNTNNKATNELPEAHAFAASTSTGLNPWARRFVPQQSTNCRNDYENRGSTNPSGGNPTACSQVKIEGGCGMASVGKPNSQYNNVDSVLHAYLERQGRNEYINLASQMGYDGSNLAFVFYENQVRRLMDESPYDERRLEVLRASCVGQPREMINLFCAPMKSMTTAQRIEKALSR